MTLIINKINIMDSLQHSEWEKDDDPTLKFETINESA